jgi:5-methylcytosine-specific restriction endonuclease McrA
MRAKRDWTLANAKVRDEGKCRNCPNTYGLQAAHIIPRSRVGPPHGEHPDNIIPLCNRCHADAHAGTLELLGLLTRDEATYAVHLVGLGEAYTRLTTSRKDAA